MDCNPMGYLHSSPWPDLLRIPCDTRQWTVPQPDDLWGKTPGPRFTRATPCRL